MGMFINPDNSAFQRALNSKIYVDKTGLLEELNAFIDTEQCCVCNSRPRRFGKSITANMLTAYYSCGCDSKELFAGKKISETEQYEEHLNKYNVIHLDVQWFYMDCGCAENVVSHITRSVLNELKEEFPDVDFSESASLGGMLARITLATGSKFIIIIDEWDVLIRDEAANAAVQKEYINFLRGLFKGTEPTHFLHLAYLTGILPIKKVKTQSALNNFEEYTMLTPANFAPYIGFTEDEVIALCEQYTMDFDGLRTAIIQMLSGAAVEVDINTFQNDMISFQNKDDVITLLIHLGYLAYDQKYRKAFIPNEEIRQEFVLATKSKKWNELLDFQRESKELLEATLDMDCDTVAEKIEKIHTQFASTIQYNDENSLSSVQLYGNYFAGGYCI